MKLLTNLIFEPKGKHDPALAYNIKDTVMSADGRCVYIALRDVPAGIALDNEEYWIKMLDVSDIQGGGGAVFSVNGKTGAVELSAADVGALPEDTQIPTVPTNVSAFTNDAGYLTKHQDLSDYAKKSEIPNVSAFITRAVNDLENYYTKSQTYTRDEIDQKVSVVPKFSISVVSALPSTNISATTIYLVPGGADNNLYTEYINVNGTWEILGSQRVDLTGYATQSWTQEQLKDYQPKGNYQPAGDYALKSELPTNLSDLSEDSTHRVVTDAEKAAWSGKSNFSGNYADLIGKPTIPTVPTKVSAFENDKGYLTQHQDISHKLDADKLPEAIDDALAQAKESGEFDGADGERGTGVLRVTTAPTSYTTTTGGFVPTYRIALSTVKSQAGVSEVLVGDTVLRNYYTYPVGYVDASYAYLGKYTSIRGTAGTSVTISSVTESEESGGENVVTFSDDTTLTIKNGKDGAGGVAVPDYWESELAQKAEAIQLAMEAAGRNKSAFLWYTDAHWPDGNSKVSPILLNYLIRNTSMNKVNFGGDIIGSTLLDRSRMGYLYEWREMIAGLPNHHSVSGNHDKFSNYSYAFLIAPEESPEMVFGDGAYYYIDNPAEKTRYIYVEYFETSTANTNALLEQGKFIVDAIKGVSEGWHIVAIAHRWFQYASSSTPTTGGFSAFEGDMLEVFDAYNARTTRNGSNWFYAQDFKDAKGKVECCIGGHIHVDYDLYSAGGIPVILTASDVNQERSGDETEDSGALGTTTEAAVFGIIADYNDAENTKITVVGVGRGTSRIVRQSSIKPISITDIVYSGDTSVGAAIDKSKFSFVVNYSNGTTAATNGATSVSPTTIEAAGNNVITVSYTEGTVTVSGTVTIVGAAAQLLNLDRSYVNGTVGESIGNHLDESKAYLNLTYGANTFNSSSCTATGITENGVTVKESGVGGVCVAYPVHLSDIGTQSYNISFDYSGTGKCRTYLKYATDAGVVSELITLHVNDAAGASSSFSGKIDAKSGYTWIIIYLSSNTSGVKTYTNVSLTKV